MVGGLVQQKDVRARQEQFAERYAGLLTAGEGADLPVKVLFAKAETLQDAGDLTFAGVAVLAVKPFRQTVIGVQPLCESLAGQGGQFLLDPADLRLNGQDLCLCRADLPVDRVSAAEILMLGKIPERPALCQRDGAAVGGQLPYDHL